MAPMNSLCCLCGSDDVSHLLVEEFPQWLASEKLRRITGRYRVEPFCARCIRQPQTAGGWVVKIEIVGEK